MQGTGREDFPLETFHALGYRYMCGARTEGLQRRSRSCRSCRTPIRASGTSAPWPRQPLVSARLENGVTITTSMCPRAATFPTAPKNVKFGQKLDIPDRDAHHFRAEPPSRGNPGGRPQHRPREDDVWSHKQILKIVSQTPIEVDHLQAAQEAGRWVGHYPAGYPLGAALQLVVPTRAADWDAADKGRRLDHVWPTPTFQRRPWQPHPPPRARLGPALGPRSVFATFDL